jgi:hypothetical protein
MKFAVDVATNMQTLGMKIAIFVMIVEMNVEMNVEMRRCAMTVG